MAKKAAALFCAALCAAALAACRAEPPAGGFAASSQPAPSSNGSEILEGDASEAENPPQEAERSEEDQMALAAGKAVFDWIYPLDSALNSDIALIAVDMTAFDLSEDGKEDLLQYIEEQSGYPAREATAEQLGDEGLLDEDGFQNGILLTMSLSMEGEDRAAFSASKYSSSLGAVGTNNGTLKRDGDTWTIDAEQMDVWIS